MPGVGRSRNSLWRILGFLDDGIWSEVVARAVGVVNGGISIVVGRSTCHDGDGRRRHRRGLNVKCCA